MITLISGLIKLIDLFNDTGLPDGNKLLPFLYTYQCMNSRVAQRKW